METARATYIVSFKTSLQKPTGDVMDPTSILYAVNSWNTQPSQVSMIALNLPFSSLVLFLFCFAGLCLFAVWLLRVKKYMQSRCCSVPVLI